jgi:GT2 family glycosyltransferase
MPTIKVSVVIPTHNRHEKLKGLIAELRRQDLAPSDYEIIIVDDGSQPPVVLDQSPGGPDCTLIRLGGGERSAARNAGVAAAKGSLVVFLDDDMSVGESLLSTYVRADQAQPGSILVGESVLPGDVLATPFGQFRARRLEYVDRTAPPPPNFCAAGNMAISAEVFRALNGFDRAISSGEDQDLALRHSARGGRIAFLPEARAIHRDNAVDIRSYFRRAEWGAERYVALSRRYPNWADSIERERVNGYFAWGRDSVKSGLRKAGKRLLGLPPFTEALLTITNLLERTAPRSRLLERAYTAAIGLAYFRGYRRGLRQAGHAAPPREWTLPAQAQDQAAR